MPNEVTQRFLESLTIASPCHVDWDSMQGDEAERFCMQCEKKVYNLSEMSRTDAERLMIEKEGRVCIRMYVRHDRTVITEDCPVGLLKIKRALSAAHKRAWQAAAACAAVFSSVLFGSAQAQDSAKQPGAKPGSQAKKVEQIPAGGAAPSMGEPCPPPVTPALLEAEKSSREQVSAAIAAAVPQKDRPKIGTLQFNVVGGKVDNPSMAVTTGDKKLDDKIIQAAKGTKLKLADQKTPLWRSIVINFAEDTNKKVTTKER